MKYLIEVWESESDENLGESYIYDTDMDLDKAIEIASWLIDKDYAVCAEVLTVNEKQPAFHFDLEDWYVSRKTNLSL
ncbi:MAG: hypothetical protein FWH02_06490 [Oscillospiraceae bacterium]|nr:hypothetical protein [Oscillospiraceae bacterium]